MITTARLLKKTTTSQNMAWAFFPILITTNRGVYSLIDNDDSFICYETDPSTGTLSLTVTK